MMALFTLQSPTPDVKLTNFLGCPIPSGTRLLSHRYQNPGGRWGLAALHSTSHFPWNFVNGMSKQCTQNACGCTRILMQGDNSMKAVLPLPTYRGCDILLPGSSVPGRLHPQSQQLNQSVANDIQVIWDTHQPKTYQHGPHYRVTRRRVTSK